MPGHPNDGLSLENDLASVIADLEKRLKNQQKAVKGRWNTPEMRARVEVSEILLNDLKAVQQRHSKHHDVEITFSTSLSGDDLRGFLHDLIFGATAVVDAARIALVDSVFGINSYFEDGNDE